MSKLGDQPAFPAVEGSTAFYVPGMDIRTYLAGQAMIGLLAYPNRGVDVHAITELAINYADALIAKLEETSK